MMRSLYTAATGMIAQETKMNVIAHNLANANTTGFKRVRPEFEEILGEHLASAEAAVADSTGRPSPLEVGLGVRTTATTRSLAQGDMINTDNPLDLAIEGVGYFKVELPAGQDAYTRAGNLRVDADGKLVTQRGEPIYPGITIPTEATNINISREGKVTVRVADRDDEVEVGQIELTTFQNAGALESLGGNLLRATDAAGEATTGNPGERGLGQVTQGFLEGANVRTVDEMIDLITTQRAYEMSSKVIQTADQMLERLSNLR